MANRTLVRQPTPEEEELEAKRQALAALQDVLAQKELEYATLLAELTHFQWVYYHQVGYLYVELDELEAQIAELRAKERPSPDLEEEAQRARAKADESGRSTFEPVKEPAAPPSDRLKALFRQVAKAVHPDLALDPEEKARRTRLMAAANDAYARGDEAALERILNEWSASPEGVRGDTVAAELVRVIRQIAQVRRRITEVDQAFEATCQTPLYELKGRVEAARQDGRDLLTELADSLHGRIDTTRKALQSLQSARAS